MSANPSSVFLRRFWPPKPWPVMGIGLGFTLIGLALSAFGDGAAGFRFVCLLAGLITAGAAVSLRLKTVGQAFEERVESAGVLAVAAFTALLTYLGTDKSWDSLQMVLVVLVLVSLLGVVLVLLPTPARLLVAGVLILIHFGGMITAATAINPPGNSAPWVSEVLHQDVYRPYLEFMYLNNAYHFYSPEPGPPALVWFHIKYKDGRVKWFKIPNRDKDPLSIHHTRLLSITESTCGTYPQAPEDYAHRTEIEQDRQAWGRVYHIPTEDQNYIPMTINMQYQEAEPYAVEMIESYVRHVADEFPWLGDANNPVESIKVYRFRQTIISPLAMADNRSPLDKSLFVGYYEGEYDATGKMLHTEDRLDPTTHKQVDSKDRFRYWYMPIYYRRRDNQPMTPDTKPEDEVLEDCLTRHARLDLSVYPPVIRDGPNDPPDSPWDDEANKP